MGELEVIAKGAAVTATLMGYLVDQVQFLFKLLGAVLVDYVWPFIGNPFGWIFWA